MVASRTVEVGGRSVGTRSEHPRYLRSSAAGRSLGDRVKRKLRQTLPTASHNKGLQEPERGQPVSTHNLSCITYMSQGTIFCNMVDLSLILGFATAALAINLAPGPDSIYTLTRAVRDGRKAGIAAALGTSTGVLVHTTAAVIGLSALLRSSAVLFSLVKFVGAGYLVYLGVQTLRDSEGFDLTADVDRTDPLSAYRKAVGINVLNPKVAIFFLAFLPQFVQSGGNVPFQLLGFGLLFATLGGCYQVLLAIFSSAARRILAQYEVVQSAIRYVSGSVLIAFGTVLALEGRPTH